MASDFMLGDVWVPGDSDFAFNHIGAQWTRFQDWGGVWTPPTEWAALPFSERVVIIRRLRWLVESNEYVAALVRAWVANIGNSTLRSKSENKAYNRDKERVWLDWTPSAGVTGLSLEEIEDLILSELLLGGECFVLKNRSGEIQLVKSEWCFSDSNAPKNEIQGIAYDAEMRPTGYRFGYLDDNKQLRAGKELTPASQVIHVFARNGVQCLRGVPWLAAAMPVLKDIAELTQAKVGAVKVQAFMAMAIVRNGGAQHPFSVNGAENGSGENGSQPANKQPARFKNLRAMGVYYLNPGEDVKTLAPQFQSNDFDSFLLSRLRAVSATLGIPIECWLEGFSGSNYSSSRSTNLTWGKRVKKVRALMDQKFLQPLQIWVSDRARAMQALRGDRALDRETFFGWPSLPAIDEGKEIDANVKKLGAGLTTYTAVFGEQNLWFEDEIRQRARDLRLIKEAAEAEGLEPSELVPDLALKPDASEPEPQPPAADQPPAEDGKRIGFPAQPPARQEHQPQAA